MYKIDENYYLREVNINDADDIYEFASLDIVTKTLTWFSHKDIEETKFVINNFYLTKYKDNIPNSFAIVDSKLNKVIGIIDFMKDTDDSIVIGYFLSNKYWGLGIMTKALDKLLDIGFNEYKFDEVYIEHVITNIGSQAVIIKNNFKFFKEIIRFNRRKNEEETLLCYKMTKEQYNGN